MNIFLGIFLGSKPTSAAHLPYKKITPTFGDDTTKLIVAVNQGDGFVYLKDKNLPNVETKRLFSRSSKDLYLDFLIYHIDLRRYALLEGDAKSLLHIAKHLVTDSKIEHIYYPNTPVPPPIDIDPTTPNFTPEQGFLDDFGISTAYQWLNGQGEQVQIANIEYGYDNEHEDLLNSPLEYDLGWPSETWTFHGNGTLGIMIGGDNTYGITGMSPNTSILMSSPFVVEDDYNIAQAIDNTTQLLEKGDILLIEQQGYEHFIYCPVEVEPAVFESIELATAKGIHVIEPAGNGSTDLDADLWNGWFDRNIQDSGAIMVGAGASPYSLDEPRSWGNASSNYGSRIDVQGWVDSIVTTGGTDMADLFFPNNDPKQAYTAYFGGTSGASAQIASVAAILNSISISIHGTPYPTNTFREMLVASSLPQPESEEKHLGGQPHIGLFLQKFAH